MARGVWSGAITFSLIHIPVSLHPASRSNTLDLDWLDRHDFAPVGYQRINKRTGKPVEWGDIVKAYKQGDQYVVLSDEDFRLANVEATQTVDVQTFVALQDIGPQYFETPYHVVPDKRGHQVYELFNAVLTRSGLAAVGLIVIRTRQHVCAVYAQGPHLMLNTLRFADEMTEPPEPERPKGAAAKHAISTQDRTLALKLVQEMQGPWHPEAYHDTYREDLLKRVQAKIKTGQTHELTEAEPRAAASPKASNIIDLTRLLRESLAQRGHGGRSGSPAPAAAEAGRAPRSASRPWSTRRRRRAS